MRKQIIIGVAALIVIAATIIILVIVNPNKKSGSSSGRNEPATGNATTDSIDAPVLIEDEGDIVIIIPEEMDQDGF